MQEQAPTEAQIADTGEPHFADMQVEDIVAVESSHSRTGYECRKAYTMAICHLAMDMFLETMPEDLHQNTDVFDRQVQTQIFTSTSFSHSCMRCFSRICGILWLMYMCILYALLLFIESPFALIGCRLVM